MHIERLHRTIKYIYLDGKKIKRLDKAIHCLLKFIRDKIFDRLITLEKGKISSKIYNLRKRHRESSKLYPESAIKLCDDEWQIKSASRSGEYYIIRKNKECNSNCTLMCKDCNFCLHAYTCTCIDNSVQWNMCKHIHLISKCIKEPSVSKSISNDNSELSFSQNLEICESEDLKNWEVEMHTKNLTKQNCKNGSS